MYLFLFGFDFSLICIFLRFKRHKVRAFLKFVPIFCENWNGKVNSASDFDENSYEKSNKSKIGIIVPNAFNEPFLPFF